MTEIEVVLENKTGEQKTIRAKAPDKLVILPFCAKLIRYANEDWKLVRMYCDDYSLLLKLKSLIPESKAEFSVLRSDFV